MTERAAAGQHVSRVRGEGRETVIQCQLKELTRLRGHNKCRIQTCDQRRMGRKLRYGVLK